MLAVNYSQRGANRPSRVRLLLWPLVAIGITFFLVNSLRPRQVPPHSASELVQKHIDHGAGTGGRWYIPPSWLKYTKSDSNHTLISKPNPNNVLEAAQLALELSYVVGAFAENSKVPLVAHQTWRSLESSTWPDTVQNSIDGWLQAATTGDKPKTPQMAYVLWDDEGVNMMMEQYEPYLWDLFQNLPYPVEKADTFRVAVLRWFGGVYADVDVKLLQHPSQWVHKADLEEWTDAETNATYKAATSPYEPNKENRQVSNNNYQIPITSPTLYQKLMSHLPPHMHAAVGAIFGLECDSPADSDDFWRMGYSYPVQLTNWAFAMAPHHPIASAYLSTLTSEIRANSTRLSKIDPLDLTGPPAFTASIRTHCEATEGPNFRWESLSSIGEEEGGRGKVAAGDVLILPITGFSPGRGWFHNMGSMPETHPNARLAHVAQGSWRKTSISVHAGKLCRTMFGACRDWKKIP